MICLVVKCDLCCAVEASHARAARWHSWTAVDWKRSVPEGWCVWAREVPKGSYANRASLVFCPDCAEKIPDPKSLAKGELDALPELVEPPSRSSGG